MLNRKIQIDLVKGTKQDDAAADEARAKDFSQYTALVSVTAAEVCMSVTKLVASYLVLDTGRKILINRLSK